MTNTYDNYIGQIQGYLFVKGYGKPYLTTKKIYIATLKVICNYENCNNEFEIIAASFKNQKTSRCFQCSNKKPFKNSIITKLKSDIKTRIKRAKTKNLQFDLTDDEIYTLAKSACIICGIYDSRTIKLHKNKIFTCNSIDRIDSSIGYIRNNVQTMCVTHNFDKNAKSDKIYKLKSFQNALTTNKEHNRRQLFYK